MANNFENQNKTEVDYVDKQKVDMFIMTNQKYFPSEKIMFLKEKLYYLPEEKFSMIACMELKDPTTLLLISLFLSALTARAIAI